MKTWKQKIMLCAGIILTGLIAACSNILVEGAESGAVPGNVLISIAGGERTILPATVAFNRYALEVAGEGNNSIVPADLSDITADGVLMSLPTGGYTVTVKAYRSSGGNEYLAAQGSKAVTVTSGSSVTAVVITLKPFIGEGNGFFRYRITLPDEADTATLNLKSAGGGYDGNFNLMDSAVSSAPIELSAGYYDLFISLTKGAVEAGEYAAVHIYSGMETNAVLDLSNYFSTINLGAKLDNGDWTGLITAVETPMTLTLNDGEWTFSVPLAKTNVTGTYTVSNGMVTFKREDAVFAVGTPSAEDTLAITLTTAVLGVGSVTLTKGTAAPPSADIEYLYSGIWTDTGTPPVITYVSGDKWTFSHPYRDEKANGTCVVYDRKAAFYKTDGSFFAVGKVATETAELTGNTLIVYPVTGGSFALTLNPYPIPHVGNWQGGDTIGGTLYVNITTWSLEDAGGNVLVAGEYVWDGNTAYFISGGARFATGTLNEARDALTVKVNNSAPGFGGLEQVFTLIPSPFIGSWRGTVAIIVTVNATVTNNTYAITSAAGNANGQYIWRNENGVNRGYFYSNGYSYGVANPTTPSGGRERIIVTLDEPISAAGLVSISSITMSKQ